ncbi:MAG: hypothetical protein HFJ45_00220 [Clostridia bacterium]|nr:hypothetical protein [Clostridia bacterium]
MNAFIEAKRKMMENSFRKPVFSNQRIHYVKDHEMADLVISRNHVAVDYLAIGIECMYQSISAGNGQEIKVAHRDYVGLSTDYINLVTACCPWNEAIEAGKISKENALTSMDKKLQKVLNFIYTDISGGSVGAAKVICSTISLVKNIPSEVAGDNFFFEYFDDTISAQKKAYNLVSALYLEFLSKNLEKKFGM